MTDKATHTPLPCPFCGGHLDVRKGGMFHPETEGGFDCPLAGMSWSVEYYGKAWNTRQPDAALVEALDDLRDTIVHMAAPARVDPDKYFSSQVKAFGDAFGYGALMTTASALWRQSLGDLQGGEFAVGPCVTTAANQLKRLDAILATLTARAGG